METTTTYGGHLMILKCALSQIWCQFGLYSECRHARTLTDLKTCDMAQLLDRQRSLHNRMKMMRHSLRSKSRLGGRTVSFHVHSGPIVAWLGLLRKMSHGLFEHADLDAGTGQSGY